LKVQQSNIINDFSGCIVAGDAILYSVNFDICKGSLQLILSPNSTNKPGKIVIPLRSINKDQVTSFLG